MSCPACHALGSRDDSTGYVDSGLCPACVRDGYEEAGCGCLTRPDGQLLPCGTEHRACDSGRVVECTGLATVTRGDLRLCPACATHEDEHEPTDEQTFNSCATEGGINDREWSRPMTNEKRATADIEPCCWVAFAEGCTDHGEHRRPVGRSWIWLCSVCVLKWDEARRANPTGEEQKR